MKYSDAFKRENGLLFKVHWLPEDHQGHAADAAVYSYVVANDTQDAADQFSQLLGDIISVQRIWHGVYVPPGKLRPDPYIEAETSTKPTV